MLKYGKVKRQINVSRNRPKSRRRITYEVLMQSPPAEKTMTTEQRPESPSEPEHLEPGWGEAQQVEITANLYRRILAVVANVLVLAEVFVAMYFAAQDMDEITPIFFKVFFSLLIPTIIAVIIARRIISARFKE